MQKIIISGCSGHMGRVVESLCAADPQVQVAAGFDILGSSDRDFPVFSSPAQFSGEAADETGTQREALCAALCGQCARQVASLVRGDLSQAAQALWEAPLEELAAAQAFYQLLLTEEAVTPASITAGDLRLAGGSRSEKAAQLVAEKRRAASPALVETDFAFCNIRKGEEDGSAQ